MSTTGKSIAQTGNGFSLEFRGLENTYLSPSLPTSFSLSHLLLSPYVSLSLTNLTAIFFVKQGKKHCRLVADLTKYRGKIVFFLVDYKTKYEFRLDIYDRYVTFKLSCNWFHITLFIVSMKYKILKLFNYIIMYRKLLLRFKPNAFENLNVLVWNFISYYICQSLSKEAWIFYLRS